MLNTIIRKPSTKRDGGSFTELEKWSKFQQLPYVSGEGIYQYRRDICGALVRFCDYGNTQSDYGWEMDHIYPVSKGGGDELSNIQALHWKNNRSKGDSVGVNYCTKRY